MDAIKKQVEKLPVYIYENRAEMGCAAAKDAAARIQAIIRSKGEANLVFAAAPSQNELLAELLTYDIDWSKVRAFHQDEYIGITREEPAGFGNFLRRAIFVRVNFKEIHYLLCEGDDTPEKKCQEYSALLEKYTPDLIFLGFGENGHMAFNGPPVADFQDPKKVKIVELDEVCRRQQVNDGCFQTLEQVPTHAMTLTMSAIMAVPQAVCVVPNSRKAKAVRDALAGPVTTKCPASILRFHPHAALYLDAQSAELI